MSATLQRQIGLWGAVLMGLGSIIGTGVFVSIGIAENIIGAGVVGAIVLAGVLAMCNGLSSAQLAATFPVSGGTYEYGYRTLTPTLGFVAGWTFLLAKSASAATAALGFERYLSLLLGVQAPLALGVVVVLTALAYTGAQRSNRLNMAILSVTLFALLVLVVLGLPYVQVSALAFTLEGETLPRFLEATALMFVAFTGYGRIATLGEEVINPRHTIPRAVVVALLCAMGLYVAVAIVTVGLSSDTVAPLVSSANAIGARMGLVGDINPLGVLVIVGGSTAMLSVLLNLILGLSRVVLAMGRRGDLPAVTARLNAQATTPTVAVIVVGVVIGALVLLDDVRTTWSLSAFSVLVYYAITNAAALRLTPEQRFFPPVTAWAGLAVCLFLAFWVQPSVWLTGLVLIGVGLVWHLFIRRLFD